MKALIVEDEAPAVRRLKRMIEETDATITIAGVTDSIEDTVEWMTRNRLSGNPDPEIIFLDIELSDGQSFEIFNRITPTSTVVFTTSYDEYALKAFKLNSIDYLLKPISPEELRRSLEKYKALKAGDSVQGIKKLLEELQRSPAQQYRDRFLVRQGQRYLSVLTDEIAYFFTEDRYSFFVTYTNQRLLVDYTLDELEDMLPASRFFRINRSMLVTHRAVRNIDLYFGNRLSLVLEPGFTKEAIVSREKVTDFKIWMGK